MRMVRAYLVEHPRTSLVTQLTNPALHERPLRGRFGSTRAGGPSRDERPERVGKSHWPRSGRTAGMGRNLNGRFGEGKRRSCHLRPDGTMAVLVENSGRESVLAMATPFSTTVASLVGGASAVATFGLADIAVQDVVPTKNLIRAGCAYRLGHPNVLTVKTVEP